MLWLPWSKKLKRRFGREPNFYVAVIGSETKGYFFEPTVLDCATQEMDIIREETFGPILPIVEYTDIDDAIAWANTVSTD